MSLVHIVDDDPAIRRSLTRLFSQISITSKEYVDGRAFLDDVGEDTRGCVLLDIRMPGLSGLEVQDAMKGRGSKMPVILLSGHADVPIAVEALKKGALDFFEKPFPTQPLIDRITEALEIDRKNVEERDRHKEFGHRVARLTAREREVLARVVEGATNKQVASELGVSSQAIDARRSRAMQKLGVDSVPALVEAVLRSRDYGLPNAP